MALQRFGEDCGCTRHPTQLRFTLVLPWTMGTGDTVSHPLRRSFQSIPHVVHVKLSAGPRASYGHLVEMIISVFSRARQKCAQTGWYGGGHTYFSLASSQKWEWQDLQQDDHMLERGECKCNPELYQKIGEPTGICVWRVRALVPGESRRGPPLPEQQPYEHGGGER